MIILLFYHYKSSWLQEGKVNPLFRKNILVCLTFCARSYLCLCQVCRAFAPGPICVCVRSAVPLRQVCVFSLTWHGKKHRRPKTVPGPHRECRPAAKPHKTCRKTAPNLPRISLRPASKLPWTWQKAARTCLPLLYRAQNHPRSVHISLRPVTKPRWTWHKVAPDLPRISLRRAPQPATKPPLEAEAGCSGREQKNYWRFFFGRKRVGCKRVRPS